MSSCNRAPGSVVQILACSGPCGQCCLSWLKAKAPGVAVLLAACEPANLTPKKTPSGFAHLFCHAAAGMHGMGCLFYCLSHALLMYTSNLGILQKIKFI